MGATLSGSAAVGHLLRRAGFGPDPGEWTRLAEAPYEQVVREVLAQLDAPPAADPSGFDPYQPGAIQQLWLERMTAGTAGFAEKLALFWHGHFATSAAKINDASLMWTQYGLFRDLGPGRFDALLRGVCRDVAMIRWLDGNSNRKGTANENFARELQELFTLGIGSYTEDDVREVARAFTGWGSRHHTFAFRKQFHDDGEKTVHGQTGAFDGDDVVRILCEQPACATFLATKLLRYLCHPEPLDQDVTWFAGVLREHELDLRASLGALLRSPAFLATRNHGALVRSPVEMIVGALRACGLRAVPAWVHGSLDRMGQILFRPPSVKGWTHGNGWLSSGAVVERLRVAQRIAALCPLEAGARITDVALSGEIPPLLAKALDGLQGAERVAFVLGGPEFQLA